MDQAQSHGRGRSPSANSTGGGAPHQQSHIKNTHSPSPGRFPNPNESASASIGLGLGLGLDASASQPFGDAQSSYSAYNTNANAFLNGQQAQSYPEGALGIPSSGFEIGNENFTQQLGGDFTIFPSTSGEQFDTPLFGAENQQQQQQQMGDMNMASSQAHHSPTPPHLLKPEPHQPGSANHSPSFNQHQFSSPSGRHSRNASLGPEAALLPGQLDWSQAGPQFQGHRRSPSEYSDVSSVGHSPNLVTADSFEQIDQSHSPMQRAQDSGLYQELHGIGSFSISDQPNAHGRSPSHSPAISPRILPQQLPEMNHPSQYLLQQGANRFLQVPERFPQLQQNSADIQAQGIPAPPSINIDFAPTAMGGGLGHQRLDIDSLTPPERGRPRSRPRAITDPSNSGAGPFMGPRGVSASSGLSPNSASDVQSDASRSLSPLQSRAGASPNRRRQSTSAVPNNVIALRLADPEYNGPGAPGNDGQGTKRVQKHPATFQCTLCPKRFTRAYNLRSHLRTHTDERPFVCTVCGKAFARQHDRKRHEGLHSGEKKFVCKGDLKAGGQWGCGRRFARADALGRHFRSEAGRICIKPLLDEEMLERQRVWNEQRMQQAAAQGMVLQHPGLMVPGMPGDPNAGYPTDATGNYALPAALLAQYPALAQMNWSAGMGGEGSGLEDDISGRSSFDASDYDEGEDGGYVSGPGSGFGQGGMGEGFGEMGYASDYGGR